MSNLLVNLFGMINDLEQYEEQNDIDYGDYQKDLPELSEDEQLPHPSENAQDNNESNPQSGSEDTEINTDSKPKQQKKAPSFPKINVPKSWKKDEKKREKALMVLHTEEDVQDFYWARNYFENNTISQSQFVKLLCDMYSAIGVNFNADIEFENPIITMDFQAKLLDDIEEIALMTDDDYAEGEYNEDAIWAAYNGIYQAAAYTFPEETTTTLQRIVDCINTIRTIMTTSACYVVEAMDMLTNIAVIRSNYPEVVTKVEGIINDYVDNLVNYGVDKNSSDKIKEVYVERVFVDAVEKKDANKLMTIVNLVYQYPDDQKLLDKVLYCLAKAAMLDEFSDQMGIIIGAFGTLAYNKVEDLTDVVDTICYIVRSKLNEKNVQLCINTLYMLADRCKSKDADPKLLEQVKNTMLFCGNNFKELEVFVEQRIMYIDGLEPGEQADKYLKELFEPPVDDKGGYSLEEIRRKKDILHSVDLLMQTHDDCVTKFLDAVHQLDDSKYKAVKLLADDIFGIFYKIMGFRNDTYENYQNVSDETKKSVKDVILPSFINIFHDQITVPTMNALAQASTDNLKDVPEEMYEYTFNMAMENIKVKGSKTYLPCLRSIYEISNTEDENRRKNIITALVEVMKQATQDGDVEKVTSLMNVVQIDTKYPKDYIQMMHDVLVCDEFTSLTSNDDKKFDIIHALELAYYRILAIYEHTVTDKVEMRQFVADILSNVTKVYRDDKGFYETIVYTIMDASSRLKEEIEADSIYKDYKD